MLFSQPKFKLLFWLNKNAYWILNEIRNGTLYPDMTGLSDPDNVDIRWLATHYPRKH